MIDFSSFFPAESNTKSLSLRRQLPRKELDPTVFSDGSSRYEKTNTDAAAVRVKGIRTDSESRDWRMTKKKKNVKGISLLLLFMLPAQSEWSMSRPFIF